MDVEPPCDVVVGSQTYVEYPDRPIVKLFERLMANDTEQNTILTITQIMNILHKEFDMDVEKLNLLEIDIFVNIIMTYLKEWPEWDKFETDITNLEPKDVKNTMEVNYLALKEYLQSKLDVVKLLLPRYLKELPQKEKVEQNAENESLDDEKIVMEVCATKAQLNNLILRHPKCNNHIFNWEEPQIEKCLFVTTKAALHWGSINITAKLEWSPSEMLLFKYENRHISKFTLVNKKLLFQPNKIEHATQLQVKFKNQSKVNISKESMLNKILKYSKKENSSWCNIFQIIHDDLSILTTDMPSNMDLPVEFRKYLSKYSYVRYMYKDVTDSIAENGENYDLQLEEMVTPICYLNIELHKAKNQKEYVRFECDLCKIELKGEEIKHLIDQHFTMYHTVERDWQCVNCSTQISAIELAHMNWQHKCPLNHKKVLEALLK